MPGKSYSIEQIIGKLREAEVLLSQGKPRGTSADRSISANKPIIAGGKSMVVFVQIKRVG